MRGLIRAIAADDELHATVIATAMHLAPEFGNSIREIEADGFVTDIQRVESLVAADTRTAAAKSVGLALLGVSDVLARIKPHCLVVLGDRYEAFAAAQAALILGVPIAHIHGGELSEGAVDDAFRHAITKMAALHFVSAEPYRRRVIQLGEQPDRVFCVGAPGVEALDVLVPIGRDELAKNLGAPPSAPLFAVTYHPETLAGGTAPADAIATLFSALDAFPDAHVVITRPNSDPNNRLINDAITAYAAAHPERVSAHATLGQHRYLSLLKHAEVVIGNSSSGIIEAPAAGTPTVNIGARQDGRLRGPSIIDVGDRDTPALCAAIAQAITPEFRRIARTAPPAHGRGRPSERMKDVLKGIDLATLSRKRFYDLG